MIDLIWELMGTKELVYVAEDGETRRNAYRGLPQGSSLSPLLYSIYTKGLKEAVGPEPVVIEFADDVTVMVSHKDPQIATQKMQETLTKAVEFFA